MFEYMAAGLPFLCSDFPFWRTIAEESGGAICVDLNDIPAIQTAIRLLLEDREYAQEMGRKGREYVVKYKNWTTQEKKLNALYASLESAS